MFGYVCAHVCECMHACVNEWLCFEVCVCVRVRAHACMGGARVKLRKQHDPQEGLWGYGSRPMRDSEKDKA